MLAFIVLLAGPVPPAAQDGSGHRLKGRIIRALAVEPGNTAHVMVGQKANNAGSALVSRSVDGTVAGATPDWVDGEQVTPLILAVYGNHISIVRLPLCRG